MATLDLTRASELARPSETFTDFNGGIGDAHPLPDGRFLMVLNRQLFVWTPGNKTLTYLEAEGRGSSKVPPIQWINQMCGSMMLFWDDDVVVVGNITSTVFAVWKPEEKSIILDAIILRDLKHVAIATSDGKVHVWKGIGEASAQMWSSRDVFGAEEDASLEDIELYPTFDGKLLCKSSNQVSIVDLDLWAK